MVTERDVMDIKLIQYKNNSSYVISICFQLRDRRLRMLKSGKKLPFTETEIKEMESALTSKGFDIVSSDESELDEGTGKKTFRVKRISDRNMRVKWFFNELDDLARREAEVSGPSLKDRIEGEKSSLRILENIPQWMKK